ncbi:EamA family transporter RarD [Pectobacterium cacticida]|uniref:EamA family transporter RarD n=1 Tax=Pectobacterium cacticida TaxID=69221 RepID=UPI002FF10ED6
MKQGIVLSLMSSALFALLLYYTAWLAPLQGQDIFAWRVIASLPFYMLILLLQKNIRRFIDETVGLLRNRRHVMIIVTCTLLVGLQIGVFGWAPMHNQSRELAMGYFMLPLMMVLVGRIGFGERLSFFQKLAVASAMVGVLLALLFNGALSLVSAIVIFGYPPYFILKRQLKQNAFNSVILESILLLPLALGVVITSESTHTLATFNSAMLLIGLGIISGTALIGYLMASQRLTFTLFGMMSYVEPLLLFMVSLLLPGDALSMTGLLTYIPIWLAVAFLVVDGLAKQKNASTLLVKN